MGICKKVLEDIYERVSAGFYLIVVSYLRVDVVLNIQQGIRDDKDSELIASKIKNWTGELIKDSVEKTNKEAPVYEIIHLCVQTWVNVVGIPVVPLLNYLAEVEH